MGSAVLLDARRIGSAAVPLCGRHSPNHGVLSHVGGSIAVVTASEPELRVLIYSSDSSVRQSVMQALGRRPHPDLPAVRHIEVATAPMVLRLLDAGGVDLVILDGEASPAGGMGVAKQLRDEIEPCPSILVLTGRRDDKWLANWSRADAMTSHPIDPMELARKAIALLAGVVRA